MDFCAAKINKFTGVSISTLFSIPKIFATLSKTTVASIFANDSPTRPQKFLHSCAFKNTMVQFFPDRYA